MKNRNMSWFMQKSNVQLRTIIGNTTSFFGVVVFDVFVVFMYLVFIFLYYIDIKFVFDGFLFKIRQIIYLLVFSLYWKLNVLEAILIIYKWHARIHLHKHTDIIYITHIHFVIWLLIYTMTHLYHIHFSYTYSCLCVSYFY